MIHMIFIEILILCISEVDHTGLFADWYAAMVTVTKAGDKEIYEFPVYSWVEGSHVTSTGDGKF